MAIWGWSMAPWFDSDFLLEMRTGLQILQACCNTPMPSPFVVFSEFHMASQLLEQNVWYESRLLIREKKHGNGLHEAHGQE